MTKKGRLIGFWKALKLCQDPQHMKMLINSKHLELTENQKRSISQMTIALRNEFEHFKPMGRSIEIHGMPQIASDVLEVIRFVALETRTYIHLSGEENNFIDKLVKETINFLKGTKLYKEMLLAMKLYAQKDSS